MQPTSNCFSTSKKEPMKQLIAEKLSYTTWRGRLVQPRVGAERIELKELFPEGILLLEKPVSLLISQENQKVQKFIKKHAYSHGELSRDDAESILKDKPSQSWLLRYSKNEKQMVVSVIVAIDESDSRSIKHIRTIKKSGVSENLEQLLTRYGQEHLIIPT